MGKGAKEKRMMRSGSFLKSLPLLKQQKGRLFGRRIRLGNHRKIRTGGNKKFRGGKQSSAGVKKRATLFKSKGREEEWV